MPRLAKNLYTGTVQFVGRDLDKHPLPEWRWATPEEEDEYRKAHPVIWRRASSGIDDVKEKQSQRIAKLAEYGIYAEPAYGIASSITVNATNMDKILKLLKANKKV